MKDEQLRKFIADIQQNKVEQSKLNGQIFAKLIISSFDNRFYEHNQKKANEKIELEICSCSQLVAQLDNTLLKDYSDQNLGNTQQNSQVEATKKKILLYIEDQKNYIQQYVEQKVVEIMNYIEENFQRDLRKELKIFLEKVLHNVDLIQDLISLQETAIKSVEFFPINVRENEGQTLLFRFIKKCIQGQKITQDEINQIQDEQKEIFKKEYLIISDAIITTDQNQSEQKIPILKFFIEQLQQQLKHEYENSSKCVLNLAKLQTQFTLSKFRLVMNGCNQSCPLCQRKCDQPNTNGEHTHQCSNGHQLRGMNGVLINNNPSLFMCEEIENDAEIVIQETQNRRKWKEVKQHYPNWNFIGLNEKKIQEVKVKMMNVWNSGIGKLVCENLKVKLKNNTIQFSAKYDTDFLKVLSYQRLHFIIVLDDSGSMSGRKWQTAFEGALSCIYSIEKNPLAKISVIIFNSTAKTVIDFEKPDLFKARNVMKFVGGGTCFEAAFNQIFLQIKNHSYDKHIILFYSDGDAYYPNGSVAKFTQLSQPEKNILELIMCSELSTEYSTTLVQIKEAFQKTNILAQLEVNVKVESLEKVWTEIVSQQYHNLK